MSTAETRAHAGAADAMGAVDLRKWQAAALGGFCLVAEWLFLLTIAVLPMDAYIALPGSPNGIFLSEVLAAQALLALGVGFLLARLWRCAFPLAFTPKWAVPLGLLVVVSLISLVGAHSRAVGLRQCGQYAFFLAVFILAAAVARQPGIRDRALWAILAGYYVVVVLGLVGTVPGLPDFARILLNVQRVPASIAAGLTPRAESTFRFPDELNAYLLLVIPFLAACAFTIRSRFERAIYVFYIGLGVWLLLLTYARSALLIIVICAPLLVYVLYGTRRSVAAAVIVVGLLGAYLLRDAVLQSRALSLLDLQNSGYSSRLAVWKWALTAFIHHPLFGTGPRNLQFFPGAPVSNAYLGVREQNGENSYIDTLANLGVAGFAVLVACIVAAARRLREGVADRDAWLSWSWHAGFVVGFVALLLDSLVHPTFTSTQVTALLCAFVGLAGAYPQASLDAESRRETLAADLSRRRERARAVAAADGLGVRVVFLMNTLHAGEAAQRSLDLAADLRLRGARVLVVCRAGSPLGPLLDRRGLPWRALALGLPLERGRGLLGMLGYFDPFGRRRSRRALLALADEEPSLFVCPFLREQLSATPLGRRVGAPVVWIAQSRFADLPLGTAMLRLWMRRARRADAVVAVAPAVARGLVAAGVPAGRVRIVRMAAPSAPAGREGRGDIPAPSGADTAVPEDGPGAAVPEDGPGAADARGLDPAGAPDGSEADGALFLALLRRVAAGEVLAPADASFAGPVESDVLAQPGLLESAGGLIGVQAVPMLATVLWTVLAARALAPGAYGDLMVAAGLLELGAIVAGPAMGLLAARELAGAGDAAAAPAPATLTALTLAIGVVAALVMLSVGLLAPFGGETWKVAAVLAPGLVVVSLDSLCLALDEWRDLSVAWRMSSILSVVLVLCALVASRSPSALAFAAARVLAVGVAGLFALAYLRRTLRQEVAIGAPALSRQQARQAIRLWGTAMLLGVAAAFVLVCMHVDVLILAVQSGASQVATYASGYRIVEVVAALPVAALPIALGQATAMGRLGGDQLRAFAQRSLDLGVVAGQFVALVVALVGRQVLQALYAGRYATAWPVLLALGWACALMFVACVGAVLVAALDRPRSLAFIILAGLATNVGLDVALTPGVGAMGPAWATLLSMLVVTVALVWVAAGALSWRPDFLTVAAAVEATGAALLSLVVTHTLGAWIADTLALLTWGGALAVLAPRWVLARVRTLARYWFGSPSGTGGHDTGAVASGEGGET